MQYSYPVLLLTLNLQKPHRASSELRGRSFDEFLETIKLLYADDDITDIIDRYIEIFFSDVAQDLRKSFMRGQWVSKFLAKRMGERSTLRRGRLLGKVTLYELQTALHWDRADVLCAIFCAGRFEGGEGIFPDLNAKLK